MKDPFRSRFFRLGLAYVIGINVFGLVSALTYVVGSLTHMAAIVAFAGLLLGVTLGVVAVWRTEKALKRLFE